jgi:hypothetical protein
MSLFQIGDLVVYKSVSPGIMKYQIGIVISTNVLTEYQKDKNVQKKWYTVQFGDIKLIVSADMIDKLDLFFE